MIIEEPIDCVVAIHYIARLLETKDFEEIALELRGLADSLNAILNKRRRKALSQNIKM